MKIVLKIILKEKEKPERKRWEKKKKTKSVRNGECFFCSSRGFLFCGVWETRFGSARFWSANLMSSLLPFGDVAAEKEKVFHGSSKGRTFHQEVTQFSENGIFCHKLFKFIFFKNNLPKSDMCPHIYVLLATILGVFKKNKVATLVKIYLAMLIILIPSRNWKIELWLGLYQLENIKFSINVLFSYNCNPDL